MSSLKEYLAQDSVVAVLDGGLATELEARNIQLHPTLWSAYCIHNNPDAIKDVHLSYLRAGADIITTASYQASEEGFIAAGLADPVGLLSKSLDLAMEAKEAYQKEVHRPVFVAVSIGPYDGSEYNAGYMKTTPMSVLTEFHKKRLTVLAQHPETQPSAVEAELILNTLRSINPTIPALVSFSCADGSHIASGEEFAEAVQKVAKFEQVSIHYRGLTDIQVIAVGANCCKPTDISSLLDIAKTKTTKPLIVYPNSGEGYDANTQSWIHVDADIITNNFKLFVNEWVEKGAKIIGGCCRTNPATIRNIKQSLKH